MRLARRRGLLGANVDWHRVTGALEAKLIFRSLRALYDALPHIEAQLSHSIRGLHDNLVTAAADPELEPPELASGLRGFRVVPNLEL